MKTTGNTILIAGGGSGIGAALAHAFHTLGNDAIITGRRKDKLAEVVHAHPGMVGYPLDVRDLPALAAFGATLPEPRPQLNVVINNAAIMRAEDLRQPAVAIINIGSGLAHVPLAAVPTYSATKAFIHSVTQSLRHRLRDRPVEVLEIIPPAVHTGLLGSDLPASHEMPLPDFIAELMELFARQPTPTELCVANVRPLRYAEADGASTTCSPWATRTSQRKSGLHAARIIV